MKTDALTLQSMLQHPEYGSCQVCFIGEDYIGLQLENQNEVLVRKTELEETLAQSPIAPVDYSDDTNPLPLSWPDSTFSLETGEVAHYPGSHWQAFVDDAQDILDQLPEIVPKALVQTGYGDFYPSSNRTPEHWPQGIQLAWPTRQQGLAVIVNKDITGNSLVSLFPFSDAGIQQTLILRRVSVWDSGLEAMITASWGAASITFFDSRFLVNRSWYESGKSYEFILTGLAYDARPAEPVEMSVNRHPDEVAWSNRHAQNGETPEIATMTISLDGSAMLLPVNGWDADDYSFHAPIKTVSEFSDWLGQTGWRVRATVMRFDEDADLDILITRKAWAGDEPPQVGQDIEGRLWLQGYLWLANR